MNKFETIKFDVTGIGCSAWDLIGNIDSYPVPGEKSKMNGFEEQGGGQVATALVTISRLGGKIAIIDTAGDDEYGDKIRQNLINEGVDIAYLFKDPGKTSLVSFCISLNSTGERTIFFTKGTKRFLKPEDIPLDLIENSLCLMVDNHHGEASVFAADRARQSGIPVVTDIERYSSYNDELFRLGTHHILPEDYLIEYTGEKDIERAMEYLYKLYKPELIVVTLGSRGSIAFTGKDFICQSSYKVEPVVDTTGAGDVFHGAFSYGLTLGYNLEKNLNFASLLAGLKCKKPGGRKGIPYSYELKTLWSL